MSSTYAVLAQDRASARLRGALYALVSFVVVVILSLTEWDVGRLLSHASRAASLSVEIAIALLLAFTFREIGRRIETAIENAFTTRRREARKGLLALAREVSQMKDSRELLERIVESIDRYVTNGGCAVYVKEDNYHAAASSFPASAPDVACDDALVSSLLIASGPVNPRAQASIAAGTMACPMMAGGELVGFLTLSALSENLEADDRQTIMTLAQSAGLALAALIPSLLQPSQRTLAQKRGGNLPHEFASLIGRNEELAKVAHLLEHHRVVCLKGAGGIGKSRLAIRAAASTSEEYPDGRWFIDFSGSSDQNEMLGSMASEFGITQAAGKSQIRNVSEYVGDRKMLLVMDNCEHLIGSVANVVHELVRSCPYVRILATSRERLGLNGEAVFEVPPLAKSHAVELFCERASEVAPHVRLDEQLATIEQIVAHLDGIPFAIELAAARLRVLTPDELAKRINNLFQALSGGSRTAMPRQQTLHTMLDWSCALLSAEQRLLFMRLGVFETAFSLEAAAYICSSAELSEDDVIGMLGHLVDKSLVQVEAGPNGQRFRLLESGRAYARESAPLETQSGLCARHAEYYLRMTKDAIENPAPANFDLGLERLKDDIENVYSALDWALQQPDPALAVAFGEKLARYWFHYAQLRTGREWLAKLVGRDAGMTAAQQASAQFAYACMILFSDPESALASASLAVDLSRDVGDRRLLAQALGAAGNAHLSLGHYEAAEAAYEESAAIYDEINADNALLMRINLANVLINFNEKELDRAQSLLQKALDAAQRAGKKGLEGVILGNMAQLAHSQGRKEDAYTLSRRSVETARSLGARQQEAVWLYWLGIYATELGRRDEAATVLQEAVTICRDIIADDPEHLTGCLEAVMIFAAGSGRALDAARIHGFIESFRRDRHLPRAPVLQSRYDNVLYGVRSALGEIEFANHAAAGSQRTAAQLLDEAIMIMAPQPT